MSGEIRHASAVKPICYPYNGDITPDNVDRLQQFNGAGNQPNEKLYEIGRLRKMAVDKGIPEVTASMTQLEYGTMAFYLQLANLSVTPALGLDLEDFSDAKVDIVALGKDVYGGSMEVSTWLPKVTVDSIGLNIADPEAKIERTFEFSGDDFRVLREGNKYFIYKRDEAASGVSGNYNITLNSPVPVANPIDGKYIFRVLRVRSGVTTELVETTDYTYTSGTTILKIIDGLAADIYKIYFSAASWGAGGDPTVLNDVDDYYLKASYVTVTLEGTNGAVIELDKLTNLSISAKLNRINESVIGNDEKILKQVKDYVTTVTLGGRVKNMSIEEILMGHGGSGYGIIDIAEFGDATLRVKIYSDDTKTSFLIGYKVTDLSFTGNTQDTPVNDFLTGDINLESDNLTISSLESDINS